MQYPCEDGEEPLWLQQSPQFRPASSLYGAASCTYGTWLSLLRHLSSSLFPTVLQDYVGVGTIYDHVFDAQDVQQVDLLDHLPLIVMPFQR